MAMKAGVPIVPVAIKNTDRLMGKGSSTARRGTIEMVILPPIETTGFSTDDDVESLIKTVHASVAAELGVADRSHD